MALGQASAPIRFGQGQHASDTRNLWLDVFGGEILTAFDLKTIMDDKQAIKNVSGGARSHRFPKTWKATAEYHTPGQELLGTGIPTGEVSVTIDDILVSHHAVSDIDTMLSHFDTRKPFADAMGRELAKIYDKNSIRNVILAARRPADGPFPGGNAITDSALAADVNGKYDGFAWYEALQAANKIFFENDIDEDTVRNMYVNYDIFEALKHVKDANGNYLILNRDFGHEGVGGIGARSESMTVGGIKICKTRNAPTTDETSDTDVYAKYRANYSTTLGAVWIPEAVATLKLMDIQFETQRDTRRLEDFMVAKMLVGHGVLRPEGAIEFKSA